MHQKLLIFLLLALAGCSTNPVQPWQRDTLARPQMRPVHPVDTAFDEHIYFSKEASSGGQSFTGGGCGCN